MSRLSHCYVRLASASSSRKGPDHKDFRLRGLYGLRRSHLTQCCRVKVAQTTRGAGVAALSYDFTFEDGRQARSGPGRPLGWAAGCPNGGLRERRSVQPHLPIKFVLFPGRILLVSNRQNPVSARGTKGERVSGLGRPSRRGCSLDTALSWLRCRRRCGTRERSNVYVPITMRTYHAPPIKGAHG